MENQELTLPIISIAPYLSPVSDGTSTKLRKETSAALHDACVKYGFFYLDISSYIDASETDELMRLAREFFALPQAEKDCLSLKNEDHARGYARLHENVTAGKADNHEGLDFYRPVEAPEKNRPLWGNNQWPSVPSFRVKYERWVEKMKALGLIVMEAMAVGLDMNANEWHDLRSKVDDSFWVLRVIGYPSLPDHHDGISCGAHKDYGCLTFLYADPTPSALQVFLHGKSPLPLNGAASTPQVMNGTWINADPVPGCVVCNIGEMWEIWTRGLYKSTLHRVIHRGSNYSIPFFFEPNFDAVVEPLPAALRILELQNKETERLPESEGAVRRKKYHCVVYGDFLLKKVGNNFASGKGKYA
ncbi:Clavaminate synthase-like protein [Ramaria rubella]|nr:Clavaminate synthase-like protein [Ramaria rubella]